MISFFLSCSITHLLDNQIEPELVSKAKENERTRTVHELGVFKRSELFGYSTGTCWVQSQRIGHETNVDATMRVHITSFTMNRR